MLFLGVLDPTLGGAGSGPLETGFRRPKKRGASLCLAPNSAVYADVRFHPRAELRELVQHGFNYFFSCCLYIYHAGHLNYVTVS